MKRLDRTLQLRQIARLDVECEKSAQPSVNAFRCHIDPVTRAQAKYWAEKAAREERLKPITIHERDMTAQFRFRLLQQKKYPF